MPEGTAISCCGGIFGRDRHRSGNRNQEVICGLGPYHVGQNLWLTRTNHRDLSMQHGEEVKTAYDLLELS